MASLSLAARRLTASSSRVGGLSRPRAFAGSVLGRSVSDSSKATVAVVPGPNGRSSHSAGSAAASAVRSSQNASSLRQWVLGISAAGAVVFLLNDEEKSKAHAMAGPNEYAGGMFGGEAHAPDVTAEGIKAGGPINKQRDKNPGKFDELNKNSRETLNIDTHDGFKLDAAVNMCAAPHKQFFHGQHLSLGSQQAPEGSYEFSTGFVSMGDNQNEGTVLNGRMDSGSGRMQGGIRTLAESGFAHNLTFAAGPDGFGNLSHETAYKGSDWTLVLKYASEPYLSMSYLQTVHPQVALGADFGFLVERGLPLVTFAGRFNTADRKEEYTAALSTVNTLNLAFNRRVSESISVASDLTVAPNGSLVQVGMQHKFRSATARGTIDTTLKTAGTLEVALAPTARLLFSAEANAYKDEYTAGFGMQIEV